MCDHVAIASDACVYQDEGDVEVLSLVLRSDNSSLVLAYNASITIKAPNNCANLPTTASPTQELPAEITDGTTDEGPSPTAAQPSATQPVDNTQSTLGDLPGSSTLAPSTTSTGSDIGAF